MLKNFLYLNLRALDNYLGALEDGIATRIERQSGKNAGMGASVGASGAKLSGSRGKESHETREVVDTPPAKFERFARLAQARPDETGWVDLEQLDLLATVGQGALVSVECEIYVPDVVKMLAGGGSELSGIIDLVQAISPLASSMKLDMQGIPSTEEMAAMKDVMDKVSSDLLIVGEDDTDWKVAAQLKAESVTEIGALDGFVTVVGKVAQRWPENRWKPLLALPGSNLLPRKERKAMEATKPSGEDAENYLEGPAVMLDLVAIYR
ncbi:DUF6414 family protein [Nocardioides sp. BYT-33-1]|uniref:DUF6414 family protein n=1 Tax=Nocardioides sp. BYT-33-1 TaxID=3416952 RepID=UPI003F52995F